MKVKFMWLLVASCAAIILFWPATFKSYIYPAINNRDNFISDSFIKNNSRYKLPKEFTKKFLYLAQVSSCLSDYFASKDGLAGPQFDHDVIVLSYKSPCQKKNIEKHITYIQAPFKTSFASGRNYLHNYTRKVLKKTYFYYIYLDEDVVLQNAGEFWVKTGKTLDKHGQELIESPLNPWRKFEEFLLSYQPPIGNIDRESYLDVIARARQGPRILPTYLFPGFSHDAMVNAFRFDIVDGIYPLSLFYDKRSWWMTVQLYMCSIFIRFHGQIVTYTPVYALNGQHSSYPQGLSPVEEMCVEELKVAPEHIKNSLFYNHTLSGHAFMTEIAYFPYVIPRAHYNTKKYKYTPDDNGSITFT